MDQSPSLILTLELGASARDFFERLRSEHYPAALNRVPAHLTLFHKLPPTVIGAVHRAAHRPEFAMAVTGLRSLGRGVAYTLASDELAGLHAELGRTFAEHLSPQDRQKFSPHIVVQNKATPELARALLANLQRDFQPFDAPAVGLRLWNYLGGPWESAQFFPFRQV